MRVVPPGVVVEAPLGVGSTFAVVAGSYRGRPVVVRRARPAAAAEDAWRRHQATVTTVRDASIPAFVAEGHDEEGAWLIEERAPGVPLTALVEARGALPPPMVAGLARALLRTFLRLRTLADDEGPVAFVHGDIGPDHVFVGPAQPGETGSLALVDFGLASVRGLPPVPLGAHGTLPYCPPERARGEVSATPEGDVYAVAATLAHAALGRFPARRRGPGLLVEIAERGLDLEGLETCLAPASRLATTLRHLLAFDRAARWSLEQAIQVLAE